MHWLCLQLGRNYYSTITVLLQCYYYSTITLFIVPHNNEAGMWIKVVPVLQMHKTLPSNLNICLKKVQVLVRF